MLTNSPSGIQSLLDLCENKTVIRLTEADGHIRIESGWSASVIDDIVLVCAQISIPESDSSFPSLPAYGECHALAELSDGFRLELLDYDTGNKLSVTFSDVTQNIVKCNALYESITPYTRLQSPWDYLALIARGICAHIEYGLASEEELALSGILDFLNQENTDAVFQTLSAPEYEPLWRNLYDMLAKTQEGLPSPAEVRFSETQLQAHRTFVTEELHAQGFEGEYPAFKRNSPVRGVRIFSSYGKSYLTCGKKDAVSYIYCKEHPCGNQIGMELIRGTMLHPKENSDIFSSMFNYKGKSSFGCFLSEEYSAYYYMTKEASADTAAAYASSHKNTITAAVKSSSLTRLTKEERRHKLASPVWSSVGFYIVMFLFCAFLFGILIMAGFMVIEALIGLIVTRSPADTAELFSATPWHLIALGSGIPFGLLMVLTEIIARDK